MNVPYKFASLPSNSSVTAAVTLLVSAWFVMAGGAILTDQHSEATVENARAPTVHMSAMETSTGVVITATRSHASL
jgi:hypothetical protein